MKAGSRARLNVRLTLPGVCLAAVLVGCGGNGGPPRVAVEGDVTFRGEPLEKGSILFTPVDGTDGPQAGGPIMDGRYRLSEDRGPVIGKLRVEIRAEQDLGYDLSEPEETVQHIGKPMPPNLIPTIYNDRSTLVVETTTEGDNGFDFHLQAKP